MEIELLEIRDFLAAHHPFDQLSDAALAGLPTKLQVRYFRRAEGIPDTGGLDDFLHVIRAGAVELRDSTHELLARLGEGDVFGYRAMHRPGGEPYTAVALEDCLLYQVPAAIVDRLCADCTSFGFFFSPLGGPRLRDAIAQLARRSDAPLNLMTTTVRTLLDRSPVSVPPQASICGAAQTMSRERISSILVRDGPALVGIVTDRDLRQRAVAEGLDVNLPITEIMTDAPYTVDATSVAIEALLLMARHNIHHLPVVDGDEVVGLLTATDLIQRHSASAVYLAGDIFKQPTVDGLRKASSKMPSLLVNLVAADASAYSTGHMITALGDAITTRLLQLAEQALGPPPVKYAWVAAGSQARSEQTALSDQDNCIVLDDAYDPDVHAEYFRELAKLVCDGLDACGYAYCPGAMMAMTDQWRQPLAQWKKYFATWIDQPEPKALMLTCVFFDLRRIYGDETLLNALQRHVLDRARGNRIFLAHMAANALSHQPPLGFFRNFVLIHGGTHDHTFDLKHNAIVPIVDLARIYTLAAGNAVANTHDRLVVASSGGEVSDGGARDLRDALEFVGSLRIRHQARLIGEGRKPNNFLSPDDLSHFERNHLKDAFSIVRTMQNVLAQRYQLSRFA